MPFILRLVEKIDTIFIMTRGSVDTESVSILGYNQLISRLNLGLGSAVSALKETDEGFRQLIDVNLNGAFWMARACLRAGAARPTALWYCSMAMVPMAAT